MKKGRETEWTANVQSRDVGRRLRLTPFWERHLPFGDRLRIVIDPGPSFGAGDHPTTVMALEFIEDILDHGTPQGATALDIGSGVGVLALAIKLLGVQEVTACDLDPVAALMTTRNLELNGFAREDLLLYIGGVESLRGGFDLVAANLAAPVLLRISDEVIAKTQCELVLSGIADVLVTAVIKRYTAAGLTLVGRASREGWSALRFTRESYPTR